jgi:general secretion pathway protein N
VFNAGSALGRAAWFAGLFVVGLVATLPLRLVLARLLPPAIISASAVTGSVWSGRVLDARLLGVPLGDVDASLSVWRLLTGTASVSASTRAPGMAGSFARRGDSLSIVLDGGLPMAGLAALGPAELRLADVSARFEAGRCVAAKGNATITASGNLAAAVGTLNGTASCENGALLLTLAGRGAGGNARLRIVASAEALHHELVLEGADPGLAATLRTLGFVADGASWRLEDTRPL